MAKPTQSVTLTCENDRCGQSFATLYPDRQKYCSKRCCEQARTQAVAPLALKHFYADEAARREARQAAQAQGVKLSQRELGRVGK